MKKILVAEDEQAIREFVVINLRRAGYDTLEAGTGEEALEIYERENGSIDVALLDIMMPSTGWRCAVSCAKRAVRSASFCSRPARRKWIRSAA